MSYGASSPKIYTNDEDTDMFEAPNLTGTPERRLLVAVLERAILDYVGNDIKEIEAADEWIFAENSQKPSDFSFSWVCQQLDLDFPTILESIRAMPKRGSSKIAPWYLARKPTAKKMKMASRGKVKEVDFRPAC